MAPAVGRRHRPFMTVTTMITMAALTLAVAASAATPSLQQSAQDSLRLEVYRFWRAPDLTLTEVFGVVPLAGLTFVGEGQGQRAAYAGALEVRDSSGLVLRREEWQGGVTLPRVTAETLARATTTQHFSFSLKPGAYTLLLEVRDSAGGETRRTETTVRAQASAPPHSDLVVASDLARLEEGVQAPSSALRRGTLAVTPNFSGAIAASAGSVGLFAEVYMHGAAPETARVSVITEGSGHRFRHETAAQTRVYPPGTGIEAFSVDLTGLPPGAYDLTLRLAFPDDTVDARHALRVLPPGAGEMAAAELVPYPELSGSQLDSVWAPMTLVATEQEKLSFEGLPGDDAKRRFIGRFWSRRAAGPAEAEALRREFEERVTYVNVAFRPARPGQETLQGWQTDRGRLWITAGPPAERHVEAERKQQTNPWEVWRYIEGRGDKYVFWDRSGFGDFILVHSTTRRYTDLPGWERYFTGEALDFIRSF